MKKYTITYIDVSVMGFVRNPALADGYVLKTQRTSSLKTVPDRIREYLHGVLGVETYTGLSSVVIYINQTEWNNARLREIRWTFDEEMFEKYGMDFDIWLYEYLTPSERSIFPAGLNFGPVSPERRRPDMTEAPPATELYWVLKKAIGNARICDFAASADIPYQSLCHTLAVAKHGEHRKMFRDTAEKIIAAANGRVTADDLAEFIIER